MFIDQKDPKILSRSEGRLDVESMQRLVRPSERLGNWSGHVL
jgi:hypothetical protein